MEGNAGKQNTKRNVWLTAVLAVVAVTALIAAVLEAFAFRNQNARIHELEDEISLLRAGNETVYSPDAYNYLAVGNSITVHGKCEYWWSECGMAASIPEKDFCHIAADMLAKREGRVDLLTKNFSKWELLDTDRAETLELLDPFLSPELDLVTVQLGENVGSLSGYGEDLSGLLAHIIERAPNAAVVVIDDFWDYQRSLMRRETAESLGLPFVGLEAIRNSAEYRCGIGTVVYGDDGEAHVVDHEGVAKHPNDEAMRFIAEGIIKAVFPE